MSETYLWSFGFSGRGLPNDLSRAFQATAADRSPARGDLDAGLFADSPIQALLRDAAFGCLRCETAHFVPESETQPFFWRASVALHDDLAVQAEEFFFPWLCQFAARDGFFGAIMNDLGVSPALLFAIDQSAVWVSFERDDHGYPAGALSAEALRRVLPAVQGAAFDRVPIQGLAATVARRRWSDMAALFG